MACHTCRRIAIEQHIVRKVVKSLLTAGYWLQTDMNDDPRPNKPTRDLVEILNEMREVDDEFLGAFENSTDEHPFAWVRFVYGNDGYDVVSDYTVNIEKIMAPINDYTDKLV
jgi:hypothetical protein